MEEYVQAFIVDAQYRVAELSIEIDEKRRANDNWKKQYLLRLELSIWLSILYESFMDIKDGYNFLGNWTEAEIKTECEYLRARTGITSIPWINFASYAPEIVINQPINGGGMPAGSYLDLITWDISDTMTLEQPPNEGGMGNLTIDEYFS